MAGLTTPALVILFALTAVGVAALVKKYKNRKK